MPSSPVAGSPAPTRRSVARPEATAAGVVAAGVALGVGELASALSDGVPSLVVAVGEWLIDITPGDLARSGIEAAGTNDKPALLWGIVIATLLIGGIVGRWAGQRRSAGPIAFAAFGLLGAYGAARSPFADTVPAIAAALFAAAAGAVVLDVLLGLAARRNDGDALRSDGDEPAAVGAGTGSAGRRAFLVGTGAAALGAVVLAALGRAGRPTATGATASAPTLPPPVVPSPGVPADVLDEVAGVSSYVTPSSGSAFYRIDTALSIPRVDVDSWRLRIGGLVDRPLELTYDELVGIGLVDKPVTLSCVSNEVGGNLVGNAIWRGVPLATLLERVGVQPDGVQIMGRSVDGFTAGFPLAALGDGRTALVAVAMNGEPLPARHGYPARLVVAGLYGYVSAVKWLSRIDLVPTSAQGYWIPRGWSKLGPIKTQSRIDVPRRSARVPAGPTAVAGVAWAPTRGIDRVEVRVDDGDWQRCRLGSVLSDETWVQWVHEWDARPGDHTIEVRATDRTGATQTDKRTDVAPDGADGHHTIKVTVTA